MRPLKMIALGLLVLPLAEIAAFVLVAGLIGSVNAFLLLVAVSFIGVLVLRKVGTGAVTRLRAGGSTAAITGLTLDGAGAAAALGGILLVVPGFITGVLGAMVMLPRSRSWLVAGFRSLVTNGARPAPSGVIDLAPEEWEALPAPRLPRRRKPKVQTRSDPAPSDRTDLASPEG